MKHALSSQSNTIVLPPMLVDLYTQSSMDGGPWTFFKRDLHGRILNQDI